MRLSKIFLAFVTLAFLASCEGFNKYIPGMGDRDGVDNMELMFLGVSSRDDRFSDTIENIFAQVQKTGTVRVGNNTFRGVDTGFGAPFAHSIRNGGFGGTIDLDAVLATPSDPRCEEAKIKKVRFHKQNQGALPEAFGLITDMDLKVVETNPEELWAGFIELCSWVQNGNRYDEYFWHIDLRYKQPTNTVQTHEKAKAGIPYPDTLDLTKLLDPTATIAAMNRSEYKLHGKDNAVVIANVWRNGAILDPVADADFYEPDHNCFDLFLSGAQLAYLRANGRVNMSDPFGYCMGRCDGFWMNTHAP